MDGIELLLRKLFNQIAKEQCYDNFSVKLKPISSGGANYTSLLYIAILSSAGKKDLHLFAKAAATQEKCRDQIPITYIFDIESFVYTDLLVQYKKIEDKYGIPDEDRLDVPKWYGHNPTLYEEVLVLENLSAKGFSTYDRFKSVDWAYAAGAVEVLAKFHALSIAYSEECPKDFEILYDKCNAHIEPAFENMSNKLSRFIDLALKETKAENRSKLAQFFANKENLNLTSRTKNRRRSVLAHGDFRPSNLMHKVNKDGSVQVIPVDYQTIQISCMIADLLYFIFSGTDEAFRALYYDRLIEYYYQRLQRALKILQLDPDILYPREDFEYELEEMMPYGLLISVMILPIVTVEEEDAPDLQADNVFESMANTKVSILYSKRLNEAVDDFIRWGVI